MGELTAKTFNGAKWSLAGNITTALVSFIVGVVLARILSVEQYGFLGMIAIFIAISTTFIDSGFSNALIRKKEVSEKDYNTIFYFNIAISFFFFILLFFLAVPIANFYNQPLLVPVTRVFSITLIINALGLVQVVVFTRRVDFKTQAWVNIVSNIIRWCNRNYSCT
jgi:O-antigen/teichoic acid export membrane protein